MQLDWVIPRADERAVLGIRRWLRRWFTSMAILLAGVMILIVVPFRDPYGDGWDSVFQLPRLSSDIRIKLFGEALAWYLLLFLPLLVWHLLDLRYLTLRMSTSPRWDRLGYRVMTLGLIVATLSEAAFRSALFQYTIYDGTNYGFDDGAFHEPGWLNGLWYAALLAMGGGIVERAARAVRQLMARWRGRPG